MNFLICTTKIGPIQQNQFDEFLYKSKHICSMPPPTNPGGAYSIHHLPPEVNIEVPSDSDSSRRPSKLQALKFLSNQPYSKLITSTGCYCVNNKFQGLTASLLPRNMCNRMVDRAGPCRTSSSLRLVG